MPFTLDTTLGELLDNPQARSVFDQYLPGVSDNPIVVIARDMSLNVILSLPQAAQYGLTREKAKAMLADINKVVS